MARVSYVEMEQANAELKETYNGPLQGKPGNVQKVLGHQPAMLKNFLGFYASVGKSLDRKLYEAVYLRVSFLNSCFYCSQHHMKSGKKAGLTVEDFKALKAGDISKYSPKEQAALKFAEKSTKDPANVSDADVTSLKKDFSEAEIVDLVSLIGLVNYTNRLTGGLDLEFESEPEKI